MDTNANPLLDKQPLPSFDQIQPDHVIPALNELIERYHSTMSPVLADPESVSWDSFIAVEEALLAEIDDAFSPASHLHSVMDSPEWREVYAEAVVLITDFSTALDQDPQRFRAFTRLKESADYADWDQPRRSVIDRALREFRLSGIDLPPAQQQRFGELVRELTTLSTAFQQNLQDATDAWQLHFEDSAALDGLPERSVDMAAALASQYDKSGYLINLEFPSYQAVITYASDRKLRETLYTAYCTRASDQGPHAGQWDNAALIEQILPLRQELASLLGFESYIDYSLETKMASSQSQVESFLLELAARARDRAIEELDELTRFARDRGHDAGEPLAPWDLPYYAEQLRQHRFQVSDEEIRPYFPVEQAVKGLFDVASTLFDIRFEPDESVPVWHPDARYYRVYDNDNQQIAGFYSDLFARKGKRGGAWMADCRSLRHGLDSSQLPVAYLNCNFAAATDQSPSLLNHQELTTLFHEFGHSLHHMLTQVPYPSVGGIANVEWDAVELPSQFLENWCWQQQAIKQFSRHLDNDEPLPDALFERMLNARHFQSGLFLLRQIEFGVMDFRLHAARHESAGNLLDIVDQVRAEIAVVDYPEFNRFLNGFGHLFAGGYAAGYYAYLWAEQLAADAFSRFEQEGIFNKQTGQSFRREVLAMGGSRPAAQSFRAFRGREPEIGPLLKSYGI